jgi:hypothetical protein
MHFLEKSAQNALFRKKCPKTLFKKRAKMHFLEKSAQKCKKILEDSRKI